MHFTAFLAVAPLALASTLLPRTAEQVNDDITGISTAVVNFTNALNAYNGGILQSQPVFDTSIAIHNINRIGFADANASSNFTAAESKKIVDNVNDSVGVTIPAAVKVVESKKPLFDAADLSSLVEATILLLKNDHETFSAAVGLKLTADQLVPGLAAAGKIDAVLQEASLYYAL